MPSAIASRIYDLYGRFYDSFGWLFRHRLARAIDALPFHTGDRVLDVGVGTGLSLAHYPNFVRVTGIDLSAGMLRQAQRKLDCGLIRAGSPRGSTVLVQADAMDLPFTERSFDVVFLSHVISTVADPHRCLTEALRVADDHAWVVLVNHFRSPYPVLGWLENAIDPLCRKLGWRCDLSLAELLAGAQVEDLEEKKGPASLFRTVFLQKRKTSVCVVALPAPIAGEPRLA
jgi:phosphatidylethanolamine/phosphatidyl-N-methylethanolamine N-methyltransferase